MHTNKDRIRIQYIFWCCCTKKSPDNSPALCFFENNLNSPLADMTLSEISSTYCTTAGISYGFLPEEIGDVFKQEYIDLANAVFNEMCMLEDS